MNPYHEGTAASALQAMMSMKLPRVPVTPPDSYVPGEELFDDSVVFFEDVLLERLNNICVFNAELYYFHRTDTLSTRFSDIMRNILLTCNKPFVVFQLDVEWVEINKSKIKAHRRKVSEVDPRELMLHANMVIVQKVTPTLWLIERYDPHGTSGPTNSQFTELDAQLATLFTNIATPHNIVVEYQSPQQTCPDLGIQSVGEIGPMSIAGLCQTWILLYLEVRLLNPHVPPARINNYLVRTIGPRGLWNLIRNYAYFVSYSVEPLRARNTPENYYQVNMIRHELNAISEILSSKFLVPPNDIRNVIDNVNRHSQHDDWQKLREIYKVCVKYRNYLRTIDVGNNLLLGVFFQELEAAAND